VAEFPSPRPVFTIDFVLDLTPLFIPDGLIVVKLLAKQVVLLDGFRFGNLKDILLVNLAVKKPVKLAGFLDPVHQGVDINKA